MNALIPQRKHPNLDDRLIPLINIVFLLLIFFLIAGQITHQQNQQIQPPISSSEKPAQIHEWFLEMDSRKALRLNGSVITEEELSGKLAASTELAQQQISLKADRNLTASDLDGLLELLRNAGALRVTLFSQSLEQ